MNKRSKRIKIESPQPPQKDPISLQDSINKEDLHCTVCFQLPVKEVYQCKNSHLLCKECHTKVTENGKSTCPVCRVKLSRENPCRSRLAEHIISKLIVTCPHKNCLQRLHQENLSLHRKEHCLFRTTKCKFFLLGCSWTGMAKVKREHEKSCHIRVLPGSKLLKSAVQRMRDRETAEKRKAPQIEALKKLAGLMSDKTGSIIVRDVVVYKDSVYNNNNNNRNDNNNNNGASINTIKMTSSIIKTFGLKFKLILESENKSESGIKLSLQCHDARYGKKRVELAVLPGPCLGENFCPVFSSTLFSDKQRQSTPMQLPITKSQRASILSNDSANFRVILSDKNSLIDSVFAVNNDTRDSHSENSSYGDSSEDEMNIYLPSESTDSAIYTPGDTDFEEYEMDFY